jgi:NAD(P)-dependent dehydrogenase (short-subunit alcohol dehydrogenase family)
MDMNAVRAGSLGASQSAHFIGVRADVTDPQACRSAVAETVTTFGALNGLIHMAAIHSTQTGAS